MAYYKNRDTILIGIEFMKQYFPIDFICGWWGNVTKETAHSFDPGQVQLSAKISTEQYLNEVREGKRDFATDGVGFGFCQWTSKGRKANLKKFAEAHDAPLNDAMMQWMFVVEEIKTTGYADVRKAIKENWSVEDCARIICTQYERPRSMQMDEATKEAAIQQRIQYALDFKAEFFKEQQEEQKVSNGLRICLDAGHYGKYNRSLVVLSYYESDFNWTFTMHEKAQLEARGYEVILTRQEKAKDVALERRGKMSKGCIGFFSNHTNACGTESVDRPVGIIPVPFKGTDVTACNNLATLITNNVHNMMKTKQVGKVYSKDAGYDRNTNRRANDDEYYGVLHGAQSVGTPMYMIIEHSFHTNKKAATWLLNDANVKALAIAEANIIADFYDAKYGLTTPQPVKPEPTPVPAPIKDPVATASYVVKKGDTLGAIAKKFGVTADEIQMLNPIITNKNLLGIGWKLTIPATSKRVEYYQVQHNDTLSKIAAFYRTKGYSITWPKIASANGISIPYTIHEGKTLYIPLD